MKIKKGIALLLALVMALVLAACTQTPPPSRTDGEDSVEPDGGYSAGNVDIVQLNGFRSINIDWTSGLVTVELYDGQGIELSETMMDGGDVSLKMEWRVDEDDSTLDILSQPLTVSASEKKHLTVKLPRSMVLHELDIHTVSADVSVDLTEEDTLTLQELDVSSVSGNVSVSAANAGEISLSTTSGAVSGSVRTGKLETDTVSGTVALTLEVLPTELEVETVSGGVALTLTEKPSVPVDVVFHTVSGQLDSDVDSTVGADCVWEIETTSGDAVIRIAA